MSTISSFRSIENKDDVYRGKDCTKKFCKFFREHTMKITEFKNTLFFIKIMKNTFYFHLKSSFRSQVIQVFALTFWSWIKMALLKR